MFRSARCSFWGLKTSPSYSSKPFIGLRIKTFHAVIKKVEFFAAKNFLNYWLSKNLDLDSDSPTSLDTNTDSVNQDPTHRCTQYCDLDAIY
jgi:hypothetical protein